MITRRTPQAEPIAFVGPLHQQAFAIVASATGEPKELDQLEALAVDAEGEELELIGWQIESWIARHGSSLIPPAPPD